MVKPQPKPAPTEQDQAAASAALAALKGFKGLETFKSSFGTSYGVIGSKNGYKMAIAPKIESMSPAPIIAVYVRVRLQAPADFPLDMAVVKDMGFPEAQAKGSRHASAEAVVFVALAPVTPFSINGIIEKNKLIEKMVKEIAERAEKAGVNLVVPLEVIGEYVASYYAGKLPDSEQKQFTEFPVLWGRAAIMAQMKKVKGEFYPELKDPGPGEDDSGEDEQEESDPD